jgi:Ser-tRNA(Ala) deacylase AlaX
MTRLLYLDDTYQFESTANILETIRLEDGRTAVILDRTIFYPQGGGQPYDTGMISSETAHFVVSEVRLDEQGNVHHIGIFEQGTFTPSTKAIMVIDKERRLLNTKSHSAGHLLDCAVTQLGLALRPSKGYHFPEGPYVEYKGSIDNSPEIIEKLQNKLNKLLVSNPQVCTEKLSYQEAQARGIATPFGKAARLVAWDGFAACGCGGTHVRSAEEIGPIIIRKIKSKSGITRISYEIE